MSKLIKKSKGFTLIELMVVMALITVLMGMAFGAMTGVKGSSLESQVQTDANTTQKAVDKFNNQSIKLGIFPEYAITPFPATAFPATPALSYVASIGNYQFYTKDGTPWGTGVKPSNETYSAVNWEASVNVWLKTGAVEPQAFMPIYMSKTPESVVLRADEASTYNEFLWLLKKSGTIEETARKVEVYRLKTISGTAIGYQQVY